MLCCLPGEGEIDDAVGREQDRNKVKMCLSYAPSAVIAFGMLCYCSSLNTSSRLSLVVMSEEGPHIKSPFVLTPGGLVFCHSLSSIPDWWVRDRWRPLFCSLFFSVQSIGEPEESPALIVGEGELQQRAGCTASHSPKWSCVWLFAYRLTKKVAR